MLTKSERKFVENPEQFSKSQQRLYRCRINKKLRKLASDLKIIVEQNENLGLNLQSLAEFFDNKAFQNSETKQETKQDSADRKNSFLDAIENW